MMRCTRQEQAQRIRFETVYERSRAPAMLSIERRVCGCDYGGNSWLTMDQANELAAHLNLGQGTRLLELGAGSGWPGLYLVEKTRCEVVLVDLPEIGLRIARERAAKDGLSGLVATVVADAADLPFPDNGFDAISHCDLLCCLERKRAALESCRRVVRPGGRMAFTVISITPDLSIAQYRRAVENGPEFIESETDYSTLLGQAGWREKLATIELGLFRRELFVVIPAAK
jgi:SAM-dependent methyltransferase